MSLYQRVLHRSVPGLIKVACILALLALALVCYSVLVPRPLPVILAMSVGHVIGGSAFACYLLAVILDAASPKAPSGTPIADSDSAKAVIP